MIGRDIITASGAKELAMSDYLGYQPLTIPPGAFDPLSMSVGEPSPPRRVVWGGREYEVVSVERRGESTARDRGGSRDRYRDRHFFRLVLEKGPALDVYFERRPRAPRSGKQQRWWGRCVDVDGTSERREEST